MLFFRSSVGSVSLSSLDNCMVCFCEVMWQSYLVRKLQREFIAVENLLFWWLNMTANTMINRCSLIFQWSKLSFNIRKRLSYIMQQNINSQCHTLGKKKMGRNAALAGRMIYINYYLNLILTFLVCITACCRWVGELSSSSINRIFLSDMHLYAESD